MEKDIGCLRKFHSLDRLEFTKAPIVKSSDNELWMESVRAHSSRPVQGPAVGYPLHQPSQRSSTTVAVGTYRSVADLSGSKKNPLS
jgi:hypothetical protein